MIILVNPMFSNYRNLNADSCYIVIKKIVEAILEKESSWIFLIVFPKKDFVYVDDGFFHRPQVKRIPIEIPKRKMDSVVQFNVNYWRKVFNAYTPDILWNHIPEVGHLFLNFYTGFDVQMSKLTIINQHHYVIHPTLPYPIDTYKAVQFQSFGSYLVDLNIFNSQYCRKMFYDVTREVIKGEIKYPETIIPFRFIPKSYPEPKPENGIVKIIYNHRLQDYKNYTTTFELLAQLWTTHKNFKVIVTNPNALGFAKLTVYPFVEGKSISNHDDYLKEVATCHLNITNTQHETFCISALESLAFGQILVAPKAMTFPELTAPIGDYPYLFTSEEEQYRILDRLLTDPSIFDRERERIKTATRAHFASDKIADDYIGLFKEKVDNLWTTDNFKPETLNAFKNILSKKRGFLPLSDVQKCLSAYNLGKQAFPLMKIKRCLNKMGYQDEIRGIEQGVAV